VDVDGKEDIEEEDALTTGFGMEIIFGFVGIFGRSIGTFDLGKVAEGRIGSIAGVENSMDASISLEL
jgi:hypothetical protein